MSPSLDSARRGFQDFRRQRLRTKRRKGKPKGEESYPQAFGRLFCDFSLIRSRGEKILSRVIPFYWLFSRRKGRNSCRAGYRGPMSPDSTSAKSRFARKDWRLADRTACVSNCHNRLHSDREIARRLQAAAIRSLYCNLTHSFPSPLRSVGPISNWTSKPIYTEPGGQNLVPRTVRLEKLNCLPRPWPACHHLLPRTIHGL